MRDRCALYYNPRPVFNRFQLSAAATAAAADHGSKRFPVGTQYHTPADPKAATTRCAQMTVKVQSYPRVKAYFEASVGKMHSREADCLIVCHDVQGFQNYTIYMQVI